MRRAGVSIVPMLVGLAVFAGAHAQGEPRCESQAGTGNKLELRCPLAASGAPQRFRFEARFSGGHDDTVASMTATLDGAPLACEPGSKTSLMGEDGDVSLECRFSIAKEAGAERVLRVTLSWSHAQYAGFALDSAGGEPR
jgi:hypothetical protein